jgi:hypothetical protein
MAFRQHPREHELTLAGIPTVITAKHFLNSWEWNQTLICLARKMLSLVYLTSIYWAPTAYSTPQEILRQ